MFLKHSLHFGIHNFKHYKRLKAAWLSKIFPVQKVLEGLVAKWHCSLDSFQVFSSGQPSQYGIIRRFGGCFYLHREPLTMKLLRLGTCD